MPRARRQSKDELEFYETPESATKAILPHLPAFSSVLDPCCGKGALLRAIDRPRGFRLGIEINRAHHEAETVGMISCRDALGPERWPYADLIAMNPPYSLGLAFFERAIRESRGATIAVLLRLGFLESRQRASFLRAHPPDVYVFSKRPSFSGDGNTDATPYAWFVCGPARGGRWFLLDEVGT